MLTNTQIASVAILQHFTHNEIHWPTAACRWHFALRDVSRRQSCHLSASSHLRVPPVWQYSQQAQCGGWRSLKWSIADLLTSSHPQMSASHLLGLQGPQQTPATTKLWLGTSSLWKKKGCGLGHVRTNLRFFGLSLSFYSSSLMDFTAAELKD